ncbi:hypothetical protein KL933_004646 [Ogataea haglerorum]|uniref:Inositol polyphosphate-related phosphatase domain-containing protein n=1 Tax=Ogataea haglerorum TaxID=1937702 RepID=A0AAN6D3E3_9ASCO|nr:hypothetical protein KL915_003877 [Ogataea haglerorum]KAG7703410.1 hypothetical protein KL914_004795 [Ogataea haglerorum]KAG7703741.1 hypothetical protein KL950_004538 [Ogataea haglerorum]KAG7714413.1 hypothetical protein KL913_004610 [Ogataea haglerorum]KAG7715034.1 hypothetical protein KL949_004427 [Ogataea haglerorum]
MSDSSQVQVFKLLNPSSKLKYQSIIQSAYVAERLDMVTRWRKLRMKLITWNLGRMDDCPLDHIRQLLSCNQGYADIYVVGFQETIPLTSFSASAKIIDQWCDRLLAALPPSQFQAVHRYGLLGLTSVLIVKSEIESQVSGYSSRTVGLGYLNWYNKGCIETQFSIGRIDQKLAGVRVQVFNMHLTHGEEELAVEMRNQCLKKVQDSLGTIRNASLAGPVPSVEDESVCEPQLSQVELERIDSETVHQMFRRECRKVVFASGDLNYRLESTNVNDYIYKGDYEKLLESDQLRVQKKRGSIFSGFSEGEIRFRPTFKVTETLEYEDTRVPSYTDRILYSADDGLEQLTYDVCEVNGSDHLPVVAEFVLDARMVDFGALKAVRSEIGAQLDRILNQMEIVDISPSLIEVDVVAGIREVLEVTVSNLTDEPLRYNLDIGKRFFRKPVIELLNDDGVLPAKKAKQLKFQISTSKIEEIDKTLTMKFANFEFVKFLAFSVSSKSLLFQPVDNLEEMQYQNIVQSFDFILKGATDNLLTKMQSVVDLSSLNEFEVSLLKDMTLREINFDLLAKLNSIGMVQNEGSCGLMNVLYLWLRSLPELGGDKRSGAVLRKIIALIKFLHLDREAGFKYFGFLFQDEYELERALES